MELLILADYYEHNLLLKKSKRLRNHKPLIIYGWYTQYIHNLGLKYTYGYEYSGYAFYFIYGSGKGYHRGNGVYYRWKF